MNRKSFIAGLVSILSLGLVKAKGFTVVSNRPQYCAMNTDYICLTDLRNNPDECLIEVTRQLNRRIEWILKNPPDKITGIEVAYRNIPDQTVNPNGDVGFFRVIARTGHFPESPNFGLIRVNDEWNE
jgi:hypothetical protein